MPERDHWSSHASQWQHVGTPLRPGTEDIRHLESLAGREIDWSGSAMSRVLLLGVTPEIARMNWPAGTQLFAADRNLAMLASVWPGFPHTGKGGLCADWLNLPCSDGQFSLAVGDGCLTLLSYSEQYQRFFDQMHRIIEPGGSLIIRYFLRPDSPESVQQVFEALSQGAIKSFHAFKWRLAQALHGTIDEGVRLEKIWQAWARQGIDVEKLSGQMGWPVESINTINAYRDADASYTFPLLSEIRAVTEPVFREESIWFGNYELADRCPTILYTPR